jgi:hypothetical protein
MLTVFFGGMFGALLLGSPVYCLPLLPLYFTTSDDYYVGPTLQLTSIAGSSLLGFWIGAAITARLTRFAPLDRSTE